MPERVGMRSAMKHGTEIGFLNHLLMDLHRIETGRAPKSPVNIERIDEATKHLATPSECRQTVIFGK